LGLAQETAESLDGLAAQHRAAGRLVEADAVLDQLVGLAPTVANVEKSARLKAALGKLESAEQLYERALSLRLDVDTEPVRSIPTRRALMQVQVAQLKFRPATQQAFIAITLRSRAVGPDHIDLAQDNIALARIYQAQRLWEEAARAWDEVLRIQTLNLGAEDLRLADSFDSLASAHVQMQEIALAESDLRRALVIRQLNLGMVHVDVAENLDEVGRLLYNSGRLAEAEVFFQRALEICLTVWGPGHSNLARNYDNLAVTQAGQQKYDAAAEHYAAALKIRDAEDALSLHHLALVESAAGRPQIAEPFYRRLLALLDAPRNSNAELRRTAAAEYESVRRLVSQRPARGSVAAKQK
jgi:tetratricopeptide (TPR) repeat protein